MQKNDVISEGDTAKSIINEDISDTSSESTVYTKTGNKNMTKNTESNRENVIISNIGVIVDILIENGLVTEEEYKKRLDSMNDVILKQEFESLSDSKKSIMMSIKRFGDLFDKKS